VRELRLREQEEEALGEMLGFLKLREEEEHSCWSELREVEEAVRKKESSCPSPSRLPEQSLLLCRERDVRKVGRREGRPSKLFFFFLLIFSDLLFGWFGEVAEIGLAHQHIKTYSELRLLLDSGLRSSLTNILQ
jgi:hypothetical protein